jgi:hypothetical protein
MAKKFLKTVFLLTVIHAMSTSARAQTQTDTSPLISIELQSSRPQVVAGSGLGVTAKIKNVSNSTVYLRERGLTLTLPIELEGARSEVYGYPAFFPTELHGAGHGDYFGHIVAIKPGDTYYALWSRSNSFSGDGSQISTPAYIGKEIYSQAQFLFFNPGDYAITALAKYWTDPSLPENGYRTVSAGVTLPVSAPQFVILFGAAMGGLIGFFILPQWRREKSAGDSLSMHFVRSTLIAFGAILLSVITTILLSRLSQTQFIVAVTVNDFWGAIAIGFATNYGGYKLLNKIVPREEHQEPKEGSAPTPPSEQTKKEQESIKAAAAHN